MSWLYSLKQKLHILSGKCKYENINNYSDKRNVSTTQIALLITQAYGYGEKLFVYYNNTSVKMERVLGS